MRNRRVSVIAQIHFNSQFGIEKMQVRQPSLVDSFYHETCINPYDKMCTNTCYHHPLYMLFNQQRLSQLGDTAVQMWLKNLDAAGNSAYHSIKSKLKDEDMLKLVKSRHCQSPSELESWLNYLNERADEFNKEVAKVLAQEKADQELLQQDKEQIENQTNS